MDSFKCKENATQSRSLLSIVIIQISYKISHFQIYVYVNLSLLDVNKFTL
jgi:uncharacterized membrane protein YwzB